LTALRNLLGLACLLCVQISALASQKEELENLRGRISAMQQDLEKTNESKNEAADALRESELAISHSNRQLATLGTQKNQADKQLSALEIQQQKLNGSLSGQQILLGKLLYQQYLSGGETYTKLLLNNQNPNQIARDIQYYGYIARSRSNWLNTLRQNLQEVKHVRTQTSVQRSVLISLQIEQKTQQQNLQQQQQEKQKVLLKVSQQLASQRREISRLQHNENRLAQLVDKLAKMLAQPHKKSILRNDKLPDRNFDGKPFSQLKGSLAFPVQGEVSNRFGSMRPDSTMPWKGIQIKASNGQAVKSIAAGRVVFANWLRGFGNLIIVDHGQGYMSLYGNNETLYKQVGDELHGGETLSAVGNSGGNEDSGLYFELRLESKPLDPLKWLAAK
jgi:murein hydrolase activator